MQSLQRFVFALEIFEFTQQVGFRQRPRFYVRQSEEKASLIGVHVCSDTLLDFFLRQYLQLKACSPLSRTFNCDTFPALPIRSPPFTLRSLSVRPTNTKDFVFCVLVVAA